MITNMSESKQYNTKKVWKRALTSSLGFFCLGYALNVFNSSQTCVSSILHWGQDEEFLIALMSAITPFGSLIGAMITGFISKVYGKRKILIYSDILTIIGSLIIYYPNTITFGLGRFIQGITCGSYSMTCSQYVSEFTPPDIYSKMSVLGPLFAMIGSLISNSVCQGLPVGGCNESNQFIVFLIFIAPALAAMFQMYMLLTVFKKESPIWLVRSQNFEMAFHSYESIYNKEFAENEMNKLNNLLEKDQSAKIGIEDTFCELMMCKKGTTKGMRVGTMVHIFQQMSGINCIIMYSTLLFQDIGEGLFLARALTVLGTVLRILALLVFFPFIGKLNTKTMIVFGHIVMGINLITIGVFYSYEELKILAIVNIYLYVMAFGCTIGPLCWSYTSQVMTDKGMAFGTGVNWMFFTLTVLFFPFMIDWLGLEVCFLLYGGINLFGAIYFYLDMIDIRGMSKPEVQELIRKYR